MNQTCPACGTVYRIDPQKVPPEGVRAQCANCPEVFEVASAGHPDLAADRTRLGPDPGAEEPVGATGDDEGEVVGPSSLPPAPFGSSDPHERAKRLARALVSDIAVYHPDRRARALRQGTIRQEFRDEIRKSWDEYSGQVGNEFARQTSYFREALNELLADGANLF